MTNYNVKLSIIVPVFNAQHFLDKCITSILNQSFQNFELILVNDGSTDNSLNICNKFAQIDSRIKIINQKNSGQSKARNVGLDCASGEYITFVDSDDWLNCDYYEKLINACEKYDADISCASILRIYKRYKKYKIKYTKEAVYQDEQEKIDIARCPDMCYVWNKIYKHSFIQKLNLRFVEGMFYEDVDFVTRAVYFSNKLITVPNVYYNYYFNKNSTVKTRIKSDKKCQDSIISKENVIKFFKEHNLKTKSKFLIKRKRCFKLFGITILKIYEWDAIRKYYLFGFIPFMREINYA